MINIPIISTFNAKGIDKATKSFDKLGRSVNRSLGLIGIEEFARRSIKAFAEDQKSAALLANTLKNLGQEFLDTGVEKFIANLSLATGVIDDELRKAFQGLFIATGSVTKAQDALKLAMDVSAGTGKDLNTVQVALSKAYLGNTTSLTRLGAGLSKTLLKTGDMEAITKQLAQTFKGDASTAANTFSGEIERMKRSMTEAQEIIGGSMVQAFKKLSGNQGIDGVQKGIKSIGDEISNMILGVGDLISAIKPLLPVLGALSVAMLAVTNPITAAAITGVVVAGQVHKEQQKAYYAPKGAHVSTGGKVGAGVYSYGAQGIHSRTPMASPGENRANAAKLKIGNDKLAKAKADELKLLKDKNTQTLLEAKMKKDQAALDELKKRYDTERLGLVAALAKATDEDTRRRIRDQIAILDGNASIAEKALDEMDKAQKDRIGLELAAAQSLAKLAAAADGVFTIFTTKVPFIGAEQGPGLKPKVDPITQAEIDAAEQDKIAFQKELDAKKARDAQAAADAQAALDRQAAIDAANALPFGQNAPLTDRWPGLGKQDASFFQPDYSQTPTGSTVIGGAVGKQSGDVYIDNSIHVGEGGTVVDSNAITDIVKTATQQNNRYGSSLQYAGAIAS